MDNKLSSLHPGSTIGSSQETNKMFESLPISNRPMKLTLDTFDNGASGLSQKIPQKKGGQGFMPRTAVNFLKMSKGLYLMNHK